MDMSRASSDTAQTIGLYKLLTDWGEGTSNAANEEGRGAPATTNDATWRHRFFSSSLWTTQGGNFSTPLSASSSVGAVGLYTWSSPQLTADVQSWFNTPASNFGWLILGAEAGSGTTKRFDTRESTNPPVLTIDYTPPAGAAMTGVYSRKVHGGAGTFDIPLPASGSTGIECRTGGVNGDHTIVFTFVNPLASVGGASVVSGTGNITSSGMGADAREYFVNLTGVANAQQITVALTNVTDSAGNNSASVPISMGVLLGDTTGDGFVNAGDALQTRNRSGQASSATNFRSDVNVDGFVNSGDALAFRARAGTGLNASAQTEEY